MKRGMTLFAFFFCVGALLPVVLDAQPAIQKMGGDYDIRLPASSTWKGTGGVIVTVDSAGTVTVEVDKTVPILIGGGTTSPDKPPTNGDLAKVVERALATVPEYETRKQHVLGLRLLYEALGTGVNQGRLTPEQAHARLIELRPELLKQYIESWKIWTSRVDPHVRAGADYLTVADELSKLDGAEVQRALGDGLLLKRLIKLLVSEEGAEVIAFIFRLITMFG